MTAPHHSPDTCTAEPLEAAVGSLVAELVRREVRAVLSRLEAAQRDVEASGEPEAVSQADAARRAGVTAKTIRTWQAEGKLSKGRRGRVLLAELRRFIVSPEVKAEPFTPTASLHDARVKRAAARARKKFDAAGGAR